METMEESANADDSFEEMPSLQISNSFDSNNDSACSSTDQVESIRNNLENDGHINAVEQNKTPSPFTTSYIEEEDDFLQKNSKKSSFKDVTEPEEKQIKRKRIAVITSDSDSEDSDDKGLVRESSCPPVDEGAPESLEVDNEDSQNSQSNSQSRMRRKRVGVMASESESDNDDQKPSSTFKLIDTDSDSDESERETHALHETTEAPIYTVNNKRELFPERNIADGLAALCDPESSAGEDDEPQRKPVMYKKKSQKSNGPTEKRMTSKEAAEQRKEIESESQRRLREANVSLPYHKPKQRNLKEFLQQRPRFSSTVPTSIGHIPAAVALRMNQEQLEFVSKRMEEREKQVEEFYKSDSEEETAGGVEQMEETATANTQIYTEGKSEEDPPIADENVPQITEDQVVSNTKEVTTDEPMDIVQPNEEDIKQCDPIERSTETINEAKDCPIETELRDKQDINAAAEMRGSLFELNDSDDDTNIENESEVIQPELKSELLKEIAPKLSGAPNYVIDLEDGSTKPNEIAELIERFTHHTSQHLVRKPSTVEMNIVRVSESGEIHKEKISMKVDDSEVPKVEEKPGVRLQRLRNNLQSQMAQKRQEMWKRKEEELQKLQNEEHDETDMYAGEKEKCIDDILDDEREFSDADDEELEDEEEEATRHGDENFFADQAEEQSDEDEREDEDDAVDEIEEVTEKPSPPKQLRRIIKPKESDSDTDDESDSNKNKDSKQQNNQLDSTTSWPDDDDETCIPAGQRFTCKTPVKDTAMQTKSDLGFLSPVCRLTGLQSFDATGKFLQNSPGSPIIKLCEPSPLKNDKTWSKALFCQPHPVKTINTICSNTENAIDTSTEDNTTTDCGEETTVFDSNPEPSTQDLLNICSGVFTGMPLSDRLKPETNAISARSDTVQSIPREDVFSSSSSKTTDQTESEEIDDSRLISQLLDEEELENFRKKFDSPLYPTEQHSVTASNKIATKIHFDDDDDDIGDDEEDDLTNIKSSKNRNKYTIVDSDEEEAAESAEEINLHDDVEDDDEGEEAVTMNDDEDLAYDSEENEIIIKKPVEKAKKLQLKNFIENEAELSESDWGSEDEDERNLDELDFELGDEEQFDQVKIRRELERIHQRQMLDADKKGLKVLQELVFGEEEDLLGAGRQRQFRWRNIDQIENETSEMKNDEDADLLQDDEGENDGEWRKKRLERELFIKSQQKSLETENDESMLTKNSQIFKLGQRALVKSKATINKGIQKIVTKQAYTINTQRGSFLTRTDQVLARVAEYTKVQDVAIGAAKNSRNFVFQSVAIPQSSRISVTSSISTGSDNKKRKEVDPETPKQLKRLRLNGFSPAMKDRKADSSSKNRLFNKSSW